MVFAIAHGKGIRNLEISQCLHRVPVIIQLLCMTCRWHAESLGSRSEEGTVGFSKQFRKAEIILPNGFASIDPIKYCVRQITAASSISV